MRSPRLLRNGASYHVTARANRQEFIFNFLAVKELFLSVVSEAKKKYCFRVESFCVMGNHVHLIIKPDHDESLSSIMRWILGVFAIRYNKLFAIKGHVWGERFHSTILMGRNEFRRVFAYICRNPLTEGLVADARDWIYGSIRHFHIGRFDVLDEPSGWLAGLYRNYQLVLSE